MERVLYFDGMCNLCNAAVQWVIRHDPKGVILFASLQSEVAAQRLPPLGVDPKQLNSVVYVENNQVYTRSDAVLQVAKVLGGSVAWLWYLRFVPKALRDIAYDLLANNRYWLFGQRESCMIPTPELKRRFL